VREREPPPNSPRDGVEPNCNHPSLESARASEQESESEREREREIETLTRRCSRGAGWRVSGSSAPASDSCAELGTSKTVRTGFWPWLAGESTSNGLSYSLLARQRHGRELNLALAVAPPGRCFRVYGLWRMAYCLMVYGLWFMSYGLMSLCFMVYGLWLMAYSLMVYGLWRMV